MIVCGGAFLNKTLEEIVLFLLGHRSWRLILTRALLFAKEKAIERRRETKTPTTTRETARRNNSICVSLASARRLHRCRSFCKRFSIAAAGFCPLYVVVSSLSPGLLWCIIILLFTFSPDISPTLIRRNDDGTLRVIMLISIWLLIVKY